MLSSISTPSEIQAALAERFKKRRLSLNFSQEGLAQRSGVSWGSLKRFERTGEISLASLLQLALVLECLHDFEKIADVSANNLKNITLDQLLKPKKERKKGRLK
jgi:transcriptional regulator with XRE-family HTH domain